MLFAADGYASHFRYGTMSWTRDAANPLQVTFNVTEAWRADNTDSLTFDNGFGGTFNTITNRTTVGTFTDPFREQYTVFNSSITQTYPSAAVFNVRADNCCRVATVNVNTTGVGFVLDSVVDLTTPFASNTGSPVAQAPVIMPVQIGLVNVFQLPFVDPDPNSQISWRFATSPESGLPPGSEIPTIPRGGAQPVFTNPSTGEISWDTTFGFANDRFTLQVSPLLSVEHS